MSTDLSEFYADNPLRASIIKKRQAEQVKLDKLNVKAAPIIITIQMYDDMIATIDKRSQALAALPAADEDPAKVDQAQEGEGKVAAAAEGEAVESNGKADE